jgi:adenylate cyclase
MKNKVWLLQLPIVAACTFLFWVSEMGYEGDLQNRFLRNTLFPTLRSIEGFFTNMKFRARGPQEAKNKIVVIEIDDASLEREGRWPWHRDKTAKLIDNAFKAGAKAVGLDIVFSEPDERISPDLQAYLVEHPPRGIKDITETFNRFETDLRLREVIEKYSDRLVLGWTSDNNCQPAYAKTMADQCPLIFRDFLESEQYLEMLPRYFDKFAYTELIKPKNHDPFQSPLFSIWGFVANLAEYNQVASHAGYFNAFPDPDGYIRRTNLVMLAHDKAYPSLPLEMARVILQDDLVLEFTEEHKIKSIRFKKSGRELDVSPVGAMMANFRGPSFSFPYVSATDVLNDGGGEQVYTITRKIASVDKVEQADRSAFLALLKDAYVFIGVSALGVFDMRAFPFDARTPGVEGHATILDNLLANDMLRHKRSQADTVTLFLLMTVGALAFAFLVERLEALPALLSFVAVTTGITLVDQKLLFNNNINWNTGFFYIEMMAIFAFTIAVKYVLEERNKKFIRGAFSKYVAPTIVDSILKDPTKLTVGGEKKELTILFSDIRGFTSFSEKMDAKSLAGFLNDYLGIMTDIVFECDGTLDKYIGDAVMAFWGAPLDQPKHAANACKAAIRMQQTLNQHRDRFRTQYGVEVNIGIGVNSGSVNVGNMGSERIFEYTVIGDHVNLASRLEGLTKPYGASIVTTRFTFDDIQAAGDPTPPHRVLDFVKVKGKKKAVELIQVLEREYPANGLAAFEDARQLYAQQRWDEAIAKFKLANELCRVAEDKPDEPSLMYVERCEEFKKTPPAADWDGSWEMHSK